jgi:hypothetical protein
MAPGDRPPRVVGGGSAADYVASCKCGILQIDMDWQPMVESASRSVPVDRNAWSFSLLSSLAESGEVMAVKQ